MARYKKEVKLSQIAKETNKVRKRFGDIVVFEMDSNREKMIVDKIIEISSMDIPKSKKDILNIHASLIIFTNIRVDVDDESFINILGNMPGDLKKAVFEVQAVLAEGAEVMKGQIENIMKTQKLSAIIEEVGVNE